MNKRQRKKRSKKIKEIPLKDIQKKTPKQLNRYSPERLRKTYQKLRSTALKRLQRLEKAGFAGEDIYRNYEFEFTNPARDLTDTEIKEKILQVRKFLSTEESTVRGQKKKQKALENFADLINKAIHEQEEDYEPEQEEPSDETREYHDRKRDSVTGRADFIDITDPEQVKMFAEFMATIKYNLSAEIFYDIRELYDLWNLWKMEGKPIGDFKNASRNFQAGFLKFAGSETTRVKRGTRKKKEMR